MSMHILVVDDDRAVRESLARSLQYSGYEVDSAADGVEALAHLSGTHPDAVIMDVMMPRLDGLEATRMLRSNGNDVPILVLTARDAVDDRVDGLDAGADDYMVKPFALDELLARLRALTRRSRPEPEQNEAPEQLSFADLTLDPGTREITRGNRRISLTRTEFALLAVFLQNPEKVLERWWLLHEVWGFDFPTTANSLEVYIGYLRRKTEHDVSRVSSTPFAASGTCCGKQIRDPSLVAEAARLASAPPAYDHGTPGQPPSIDVRCRRGRFDLLVGAAHDSHLAV